MGPEQIAKIIALANGLLVDRYANTAGATAWFYDYLLTLSDEYEHIWKKEWSLVKALYLLNRYGTPPFLILVLYHLDGEQRGPLSAELYALPSPYSCQPVLTPLPSCIFYDITVTAIRGIQLLSSTWLILIVVQSLSLNNRYVKCFLYMTFIAMNITATVFGVITLREMYPTIKYLDSFRICFSSAPDSTRWLYMCQVPFDILLLAIELFYYWRFHRLVAPAQPTKLLVALYLDGVWYFVVTITVKLSAGLIVIFAEPSYWYVATSADQAFTSAFIARLVLHLRSISQPPSASYAGTSASEIITGARIGAEMIPELRRRGVGQRATDQGPDDEGFLNKTQEGDEDEGWRHREEDAIEMDVQNERKGASLASRCLFRR